MKPRADLVQIFTEHHAKALRLAYLVTGDAGAAEDVVAEAFAKMARNPERRIDHPGAYVRRAVLNEANSRWRRLARERVLRERITGDDRGQPDASEDLANQDLVWQALRQLPQRQRTALVLRFYADATEREAAEAMGVSVGTVKSTTARGLQRLKTLIGDAAGPALPSGRLGLAGHELVAAGGEQRHPQVGRGGQRPREQAECTVAA